MDTVRSRSQRQRHSNDRAMVAFGRPPGYSPFAGPSGPHGRRIRRKHRPVADSSAQPGHTFRKDGYNVPGKTAHGNGREPLIHTDLHRYLIVGRSGVPAGPCWGMDRSRMELLSNALAFGCEVAVQCTATDAAGDGGATRIEGRRGRGRGGRTRSVRRVRWPPMADTGVLRNEPISSEGARKQLFAETALDTTRTKWRVRVKLAQRMHAVNANGRRWTANGRVMRTE